MRHVFTLFQISAACLWKSPIKFLWKLRERVEASLKAGLRQWLRVRFALHSQLSQCLPLLRKVSILLRQGKTDRDSPTDILMARTSNMAALVSRHPVSSHMVVQHLLLSMLRERHCLRAQLRHLRRPPHNDRLFLELYRLNQHLSLRLPPL
jgi:hypothetical protein